MLALSPLTVTALAWSVGGIVSGTLGLGFVVLMTVATILGSGLRIQLPRTKLYLALSDAIVVFSLIVYGGELAVFLMLVGSVFLAFGFTKRKNRAQFVSALTNISISIVTVFITAVFVASTFGIPDSLSAILHTWDFVLLIAFLTIFPFVLNSCLASAALAIKGDKKIIDVWRIHATDAILIYFGASLMAGLCVVALHEISAFLFLSVAGFLLILQLAFRRYSKDQNDSIAEAERSERERAELAEKHVVQLEHYIAELQSSSEALTESREKFRHAAYHDLLTGLPNRNQFVTSIEALLLKTRVDPKHRFALFYLDLDGFKTVNDSLGHSSGDELISQVAERLTGLTTNKDQVGRFGGDEFAILKTDLNGTEGVTAFAKKIVDAISEPFILNERHVFTQASIGIAIGHSTFSNAEDVLRGADMAMYRAKDENKSFVIFANEFLERAKLDLQIETDLRFAIARNEFELYYQPIVDLEYSQMIGFEALVRWNHPKIGLVEPERFIPVSELTGLVVPMTLQILELACSQLVEWQNRIKFRQPLFVSVNLSGRHFEQTKLIDDIVHVLEKTRINPRCLKLEITETAAMDNPANAIPMLRRIKELGVNLSIDDFGTGYSSLSYLQRFPIDTLKIDRAFVRSMEEGRQNGEIVRAVLALAAALRLNVVAEGIESIHQLHQLRILNCQAGQGYLFSPPLPAAEFEELISDQSRWENLASGGTFAIVGPPNIRQSAEIPIQ